MYNQSFNLSSGATSMAVTVHGYGGPGASIGPVASASSGLRMALKVNSTGAHTVSANWSLAWKAHVDSGPFTGRAHHVIANVYAAVVLVLLDWTNNTSISNYWTLISLSSFYWNTTTGWLNSTFSLSGQMIKGHAYTVESYVSARTWTGSSGPYYARPAHASFTMTGPSLGGTLNWISLS